jgi:hypothetical protein
MLRLATLFVLVFGVLCLNYTKAAGVEHHVEWASAHGLPAPSYAIFVTGAALTALAAWVLGYSMGRPSSR